MSQSISMVRPSLTPPVFTGERESPSVRAYHPDQDARKAPVTPQRTLPQIDRSQVSPEVLKAAEGMEALFVDYLMKVMRETVPKNEMDLESPATNIYRGMLDSEIAQQAAHRGGIGLTEQIIAYLESGRYNVRGGERQ